MVTHNELYDLPYTGITAGVIQGHVDLADHPSQLAQHQRRQHDQLQPHPRLPAGARRRRRRSTWRATRPPTSTRPTARRSTSTPPWRTACKSSATSPTTRAPASASFYDDAGSEWIHYAATSQFHTNGANAQGGCAPTGHFLVDGNYFSAPARPVHLRQRGRQPRRQQHHHPGLAGAERPPADAAASRRPGRVGPGVRRRDQPGDGLRLGAPGDVLERHHRPCGC